MRPTSRFSRLFKLVNYTEEITNLLNDTKGRCVVTRAAFSHISIQAADPRDCVTQSHLLRGA